MTTRASDADRADVANLLREAAAEGRLTISELSDRLSAAMAARTYADLHQCLRELPEYSSYKPWQKIRRSEVQIVNGGIRHRRRGGLAILGPVIVVAVGFAILTALSGMVAWLVLLPLRMFLDVILFVILYRVLRFILHMLR